MSKRNVLQTRQLQDLIGRLDKADGYFLGVTILEKGVNQHLILSEEFPFADLLRSWKKVRDLCIESLEEDLNVIPMPSKVDNKDVKTKETTDEIPVEQDPDESIEMVGESVE